MVKNNSVQTIEDTSSILPKIKSNYNYDSIVSLFNNSDTFSFLEICTIQLLKIFPFAHFSHFSIVQQGEKHSNQLFTSLSTREVLKNIFMIH